MSDKPEKIEWRELDWRYCGLVGGVKFYLIQRKVYTEPELHNTAIIEILETGEWWEFDTVKEAKTKAEELLTEWLIKADLVRRFENVNDAIFTESELAKQLAEATKEIDQLRADLAKPSEWISVELKRLLLAVNAVTGQHRHHNLPTKKALDNLANRQLEYEESLNQHPSPPTRETP